MPKVLPEYLELRRQQIVDAAAACFTRSGFHQTTMQDICTEADLSPGAVYRYFRSKEEIIQSMCERGPQEDSDVIREIIETHTTREAMEELTRIFFEGVEDREMCALSIELLAETRRDPVVLESVRTGLHAIFDALEGLVRRAQARGEMRQDMDPVAMSHVMMGLYQGLIWQKVVDPDMDVMAYASAVKYLFEPHHLDNGNRLDTSARKVPSALQH